MPRETGSGKGEETSFFADKSQVITKPEDAPVERKDQYLKRIKAEDEALKREYVVTDQYIEVIGKKVLLRTEKKNGNQYSQYLFNRKRFPNEYKEMEKLGGWLKPTDDDKQQLIPIKFVDGRPFVKKGA